MVLVGNACAEIGDPYLGEGVAPPSTTVQTDETVDDADTQEVVSASVSPVFTPSRPEGYDPLVLVAAAGGLALVGEVVEAVPTPFPVGSVSRAVDDYLGGLVVELEGQTVQWLPADSDTPPD